MNYRTNANCMSNNLSCQLVAIIYNIIKQEKLLCVLHITREKNCAHERKTIILQESLFKDEEEKKIKIKRKIFNISSNVILYLYVKRKAHFLVL